MLHLSNNQITVHLLDPFLDQEYFGSRYCTGGYIWQIADKQGNHLFSGPRYPALHPPVFDGQGAPEAFVSTLGSAEVPVGSLVTVPGVGNVVKSSNKTPFHVRDNPEVREFCKWHIDLADDQVCMETQQESEVFSCNIERRIMLIESTVVSRTVFRNHSQQPYPLTWFAHPFFPVNHDLRCAALPSFWQVPENAGYLRSANGDLCMKPDFNWEIGLFQQLDIKDKTDVDISVYNQNGGVCRLTTDYSPNTVPVWANAATFSLEPYLVRTVPAGGESAWEVCYDFSGLMTGSER